MFATRRPPAWHLALLRSGAPALLLALLAGCGGGANAPAPNTAGGGDTAGPPPAAALPLFRLDEATAGTIAGVVKFDGQAPARVPIEMTGNYCLEAGATPPLSETVIVNENGTLKNVFVYVRRGLPKARFSMPEAPAELDQKLCMYRPHVFGLRAGQTLLIKNSDPTMHNVHMKSRLNSSWNFGQPTQGIVTRKSFARQEVMVTFACDLHSWMNAYAGVLDHPFFAITGNDGSFALPRLPAGNYQLRAWHEKYGRLTQDVTVQAQQTATVEFAYAP